MTTTPAATPATTAWFHCFAGIAGDMALGCLLDAGADLDQVRQLLGRLPLGGWSLDVGTVLRAGLASTRVVVRAEDTTVVRTHAHIVGLVEEARLPERVRRRALDTFAALAQAEGRLHGRPPSQVHFHEVGGHDAIVDIVGTCAALEVLAVERIVASPVATGTGVVRTAHGVLPNPSPAVVELLRGAPVEGRSLNVELTTPTGAALMSTLAASFGPMPAMVVKSVGYGAGAREIDGMPNVTQVVLGWPEPEGDDPGLVLGPAQPMVVVETTVDDVTGEVLAHTVAALLEAGALDAWVTPVVMKKGRPGHVVTALADPALAPSLARLLRGQTGSLGARGHVVQRWAATRSMETADVDGQAVRVKVSPGRIKAEHDDAARAARHLGLPLSEVLERAEGAVAPERTSEDCGR